MAKKRNYNEAAMRYALDYLERILDMEDYIEDRVEKKLDSMVERKLAQQHSKVATTEAKTEKTDKEIK